MHIKNWIDLFDSNHTIYANKRHLHSHFKLIAKEISGLIPSKEALVIDFSCGEAIYAFNVAENCKKLILAEPAPGIRGNLKNRFSNNPKIEIHTIESLNTIKDNSIDLVVMHSVSQYMNDKEFDNALYRINKVLKNSGIFVLGDVLPETLSTFDDALELLKFAIKENFFIAALVSLVKTLFSNYRKIRSKIGVNKFSDKYIKEILRNKGFNAIRQEKNIGHNSKRITYLSYPR